MFSVLHDEAVFSIFQRAAVHEAGTGRDAFSELDTVPRELDAVADVRNEDVVFVHAQIHGKAGVTL